MYAYTQAREFILHCHGSTPQNKNDGLAFTPLYPSRAERFSKIRTIPTAGPHPTGLEHPTNKKRGAGDQDRQGQKHGGREKQK